MTWAWVIVVIAAVMVVMMVCFAVWLWHKAGDVLGELVVLGRRLGEMAELMDRLDLSPLEAGLDPGTALPGRTSQTEVQRAGVDLADHGVG